MERFRSFTRAPDRPRPSDLVVAAALFVWAAIEAIQYIGPGPIAARLVYAALISVPLAFRRRAPFGVTVFLVVVTVMWALEKGRVAEHGTMPFPQLVVATFSVACYARSELVGAVGGLLLFASAILHLAVNWFPGSNNANEGGIVAAFLFFGGAWGAGWLVRQRAAEARRAVAESGALAELAVNE